MVKVHEPEALRVPLGPLEVVDQRPCRVSGNVDACRASPRQRCYMPVQVCDALAVVEWSVDGVWFGERRPVLVRLAHAHQQVGERVGIAAANRGAPTAVTVSGAPERQMPQTVTVRGI